MLNHPPPVGVSGQKGGNAGKLLPERRTKKEERFLTKDQGLFLSAALPMAPKLHVDIRMSIVLLLGRDPNFAWALQKILGEWGFRLEHVYTLSEARLRMERFAYGTYILDGLKPEEIEAFERAKGPGGKVIVFDVQPEAVPAGATFLLKGVPLPSMISSLREALE